jgi:hypothetical protein
MTHSTSLKDVIALCHEELGQLFFVHQESILVGDLPHAIETLEQFTQAHDLHKSFEDTHLLPKLAELDDPGDWPASLYNHEHNKIGALLIKLTNDIAQLNRQKLVGTALHVELIELLDREKSFKGLCEHHQEREEKGMLPALDRQTETAWRQSIIEPFTDEWRAMVAG